ncbi:sugar ABC transporter ATP-binding protein [Naasia lichenicola]|uniref:Sugar ABC transporter ATP-binding protein n=1 Tax=Naasia lichenicola TaxID=2565933 RepID=A0A4S4FQE1_9MICO|nr:sugar ABC transporter ATP-binding protein [Naasia lichenicola]THG32813.1 sugar ABC transporter ATP-binding protein [Naasia lichenicola]
MNQRRFTPGEAAPAAGRDASAPRLQVSGLSKSFLGANALDDVSFTIEAGEVLALIGENGAGKSTLIKILSGAHRPDAGEVLVNGERVDILSPRDSEDLGIATVYQELSLFPELSVAENLVFGSFPGRGIIDWRSARKEATEFLASLDVHIDVTKRVRELSIAEKQMLEIAKALHRRAQIVILDEPTAVLGGEDVDHLLALVEGLKKRGVSVIFVSHRLEEVFGLADHYVVLKDGRLTGAGRISETDHDDLVSKMVGREFARSSRSVNQNLGDVVLAVEHLVRDGVLDDVSLTVRAGEVLGIAGLRGAGRTELARAIYGADTVNSGTVRVNGVDVPNGSPLRSIRAGIGLVPEERKTQGIFIALSTAANIPVVKMLRRGLRVVRPAAERRLALAYKDKLRIKVGDVNAPVAQLSGGNQQKVVLSKWLDAGVDVLILDEPTRGIDVGAKQEIYELIRGLCEQGLAIIVISSELPEVLSLSHRIIVMHHGSAVAELDGETATEEQVMNYAVGGRGQ